MVHGDALKAPLRAVRKQSAAIRRPETKPQEAVVSVLEAPEPELAGKRFAFGEQLMVGAAATTTS